MKIQLLNDLKTLWQKEKLLGKLSTTKAPESVDMWERVKTAQSWSSPYTQAIITQFVLTCVGLFDIFLVIRVHTNDDWHQTLFISSLHIIKSCPLNMSPIWFYLRGQRLIRYVYSDHCLERVVCKINPFSYMDTFWRLCHRPLSKILLQKVK